MSRRCTLCGTANIEAARFCSQCGAALSGHAATQRQPLLQKRGMSNSSILSLVLGVCVLGLCGLCGLFGAIGSLENKTQPTATLISNTSNTSAPKPSTQSSSLLIPSSSPTANPQMLPAQAEQATVITQQANLRLMPNADSDVVTVLKQGDVLKLVSQKPNGPWYRVSHVASGKQGWINGKGIELSLKNASSAPSVSLAPSPKQPQIKSEGDTDSSDAELEDEEPARGKTQNSSRATKRGGSGGRGYYNSRGEFVPSPTFSESAPAGASAKCRDGSYSFSRSRRGTCSRHGGVARWL